MPALEFAFDSDLSITGSWSYVAVVHMYNVRLIEVSDQLAVSLLDHVVVLRRELADWLDLLKHESELLA